MKLQKYHMHKTVIYQQYIWKPKLKMFTPVFEFSSTLHSSVRKHKRIYAASIHCALTCYFILKINNSETPLQKLIPTL